MVKFFAKRGFQQFSVSWISGTVKFLRALKIIKWTVKNWANVIGTVLRDFFLHNAIPSELLIHLIKYFSYIVLISQKYLPVQKYSPVQKNIYEFFTLFCRQTILSGKQADLNFRIRKRVLTISCQAIYIIYNQRRLTSSCRPSSQLLTAILA